MPPFPVSELLVMSWSAGNPRDSSLFTSWGVLYRFETAPERRKTVTTIWRAISETKQERVARFEWNSDGDLGRALIGTHIHLTSCLDPSHSCPQPIRSIIYSDGRSSSSIWSGIDVSQMTQSFSPCPILNSPYLYFRMWTGPDGYEYTWTPSTTTPTEILVSPPRSRV